MEEKNQISNSGLGLLWFGGAVSLAEILTGALIAPLGMGRGFAAIVFGHLIGCAILYLTGLIGSKSGLSAIESTKISFGRYGAYLFALLNITQLVGWTGVMIINGAKALDIITVSVFQYSNTVLWCILAALLICLWILIGFQNLSKINVVAIGSLFVFTLILGYVVFFSGNGASMAVEGTLSFGAALELSIIMPLSWLPLIADYTSHAKEKRKGVLFSAGGYFIGSTFMYTIGLGGALFAGTSDISAILLAAGLPAVALLTVLFSTVTTTFLDVYSAAVSFTVLKHANERVISLIVCGIGLLIAIFIPSSNYEWFLYLIGTAFAPLFAILIADYFILKKQKLYEGPLDLRNAGIWVAGVILYRIMMNVDTVLGSTIPTMLILVAVCFVSEKVFGKKEA